MHRNCLHPEGESCVFCAAANIMEKRKAVLGQLAGDHSQNESDRACVQSYGVVLESLNKPVFEAGADPTLDEVRATYKQRGGEYADSWHEDNIVTTFTAATLASFGLNLTVPQMRLLQCASLIDIKDSRMGGPWKRDSVVDGIAYRALYASLRDSLST